MSEETTVTVRELLQDADAARERMSKRNPNRWVIERLQLAVIELAQRAAPEASNGDTSVKA